MADAGAHLTMSLDDMIKKGGDSKMSNAEGRNKGGKGGKFRNK